MSEWRHVPGKTWDAGNPAAVDNYVTWCKGCGARPWPCDAEQMRLRAERAEDAIGRFLRRVGGMTVRFAGGEGYVRVPNDWVDDLAEARRVLEGREP